MMTSFVIFTSQQCNVHGNDGTSFVLCQMLPQVVLNFVGNSNVRVQDFGILNLSNNIVKSIAVNSEKKI